MAKKKTRKKAGGRKVAKKAGGSLRRISTGDLSAELQRRSQDISGLEAKRASLLDEVGMIDAEISVISAAMGAAGQKTTRKPVGRPKGSVGRPKKSVGRPKGSVGRKRPRNAASLEVSLASALKGKTMGVSESAAAVKKAGYKSSSPNFRTIVNQALIRSELIKKVGRGQYTAK